MSRYTRRTSSRLGRFERQKFGFGGGIPGYSSPVGQQDFMSMGIETPYETARRQEHEQFTTAVSHIQTSPQTSKTSWIAKELVSQERQSQFQYDKAAAAAKKTTSAPTTADSGFNWGEIGGFFTGLIGAAAPIAGGIYMSGQQADAQKDMMQLMLQGGRASAQPATIVVQGGGGGGSSKMGLYIGLGVVGFIVLIGGIILIAR